jgi:hypothetical protein
MIPAAMSRELERRERRMEAVLDQRGGPGGPS